MAACLKLWILYCTLPYLGQTGEGYIQRGLWGIRIVGTALRDIGGCAIRIIRLMSSYTLIYMIPTDFRTALRQTRGCAIGNP